MMNDCPRFALLAVSVAMVFLVACQPAPTVDDKAAIAKERFERAVEQEVREDSHDGLRLDADDPDEAEAASTVIKAEREVDRAGPKPLVDGLQKGNRPPGVSVTSIDGRSFDLRSLSDEGKPALLYFMATWCPHCHNDFVELEQVFNDYKDDVEIISISLDSSEDVETLTKYFSRYPGLSDLLVAEADVETLKNYQIKYTTTKYAVGADGDIIYAGSGEIKAEQWGLLLESLKNTVN